MYVVSLALHTADTEIAGSILQTEPESDVEPGSDKWQYVERPVPEVCVYVCVRMCARVCSIT